ncbi:histidinol-phosphate transaminase [Microbotryomycetes sp. JL201]|nr:histidinol-phosphate transaminase [Microbotryomycetes sp. JL201]
MKPAQFTLKGAIRPNILSLEPYRSARDDYQDGILLDANENALGHALPPPASSSAATDDTSAFDQLDLHRYPSPVHEPLKQQICKFRNLPSPRNIFLGVGSDEAIDLLFRITCTPGRDRVLVCPPTYGMYGVCAHINDVDVVKVNLDARDGNFLPNINKVLSDAASSPNPIKLVFLCSPGNPTGTAIPLDDVRAILANPDYKGLVVVDEAYIDFAPQGSTAVNLLVQEGWSNLVVMQTLSKGFGLAAIRYKRPHPPNRFCNNIELTKFRARRLGLAFSSPEIIQVLNNIKAPYNVSTPTAALASRALSDQGLTLFRKNIATLIDNREYLRQNLLELPNVLRILGANHGNFLMAQVGTNGQPDNEKAQRIYKTMASDQKVVVRFRGNEYGCAACLRITVGTRQECDVLLEKLRMLLQDN